MSFRKEYFKGYEVVSENTRREEGKYYLDEPGKYEASDVHVVLFKRENGKNRVFYLVDLDMITTLSKAEFFDQVSDEKFREALQKAAGVKSIDIYVTKAAKEILQVYNR